jgi:hypothetical protein
MWVKTESPIYTTLALAPLPCQFIARMLVFRRLERTFDTAKPPFTGSNAHNADDMAVFRHPYLQKNTTYVPLYNVIVNDSMLEKLKTILCELIDNNESTAVRVMGGVYRRKLLINALEEAGRTDKVGLTLREERLLVGFPSTLVGDSEHLTVSSRPSGSPRCE